MIVEYQPCFVCTTYGRILVHLSVSWIKTKCCYPTLSRICRSYPNWPGSPHRVAKLHQAFVAIRHHRRHQSVTIVWTYHALHRLLLFRIQVASENEDAREHVANVRNRHSANGVRDEPAELFFCVFRRFGQEIATTVNRKRRSSYNETKQNCKWLVILTTVRCEVVRVPTGKKREKIQAKKKRRRSTASDWMILWSGDCKNRFGFFFGSGTELISSENGSNRKGVDRRRRAVQGKKISQANHRSEGR